MSEEKVIELPPFNPMSGSTTFGIIPTPVGTLAEIEREGMDPDKVGCCHSRAPGVRGCLVYKSCQFNLRERGGFKDDGPHFIAYRHRTSNADGARVHENCVTCYHFVMSLQGRMNAGVTGKMNGVDHETIRIVAQEGELYVPRRIESVTPRGGPTGNDIRERELPPVPVRVPVFPRPKDNPGLNYDATIRRREKVAEVAEDAATVSREEEVRRMIQEGTESSLVANPDLNPALPATGQALAREKPKPPAENPFELDDDDDAFVADATGTTPADEDDD